jgi:hypothetical protein
MKRFGHRREALDPGILRSDGRAVLPSRPILGPVEGEVQVHAGEDPRSPLVPLMEEGRFFSRYLLGGQETTEAVLERYAEASRILFRDPATPADLGVLRFLERRHWALPFLDAAAGLVDRDSLLRRKLLLTFAILETTPAHADAFTPVPGSRPAVVARLFAAAASSAFKALAGLLIYPFAKRSR